MGYGWANGVCARTSFYNWDSVLYFSSCKEGTDACHWACYFSGPSMRSLVLSSASPRPIALTALVDVIMIACKQRQLSSSSCFFLPAQLLRLFVMKGETTFGSCAALQRTQALFIKSAVPKFVEEVSVIVLFCDSGIDDAASVHCSAGTIYIDRTDRSGEQCCTSPAGFFHLPSKK